MKQEQVWGWEWACFGGRENNSINSCQKGDWLPKWAPGFVTDCENTCAVSENKVSAVS